MYLPFAHIFGLICDMFATFAGVPVGYGSPRTLTDSQVRNCKGDIAAFKPSILIGVPQVFDSVRKGVLNKIEELSPLSKWIFFKALKTKSFLKSNGLKGNFVDPIFKAVRQQFGGRLRYAVNAGSPVSQAVFNFISNVCCPFVNAYGMTELTGPSFSTVDDLDNTDSIGLPPSQWEFKLVDVPDLGYLTTNTPAQGELWVRGKGVTMGYFKNPEASAETYHPDGWVMTGDVARLNSDGTVSIIDRKKNLAKLSNGEYVALEKLETVYRNSTLLERVCVIVNSEKPKPIAVIYPSWAGLGKFVARKNIALEGEISSSESLSKLKSAMLQELRTEATQSGLKGGELIADIVITKEDWTVENGLLTSAMKLKRKEVQTRFSSEIQNAFSQFN
jgi:long-chain acyl-CoA synthetase